MNRNNRVALPFGLIRRKNYGEHGEQASTLFCVRKILPTRFCLIIQDDKGLLRYHEDDLELRWLNFPASLGQSTSNVSFDGLWLDDIQMFVFSMANLSLTFWNYDFTKLYTMSHMNSFVLSMGYRSATHELFCGTRNGLFVYKLPSLSNNSLLRGFTADDVQDGEVIKLVSSFDNVYGNSEISGWIRLILVAEGTPCMVVCVLPSDILIYIYRTEYDEDQTYEQTGVTLITQDISEVEDPAELLIRITQQTRVSSNVQSRPTKVKWTHQSEIIYHRHIKNVHKNIVKVLKHRSNDWFVSIGDMSLKVTSVLGQVVIEYSLPSHPTTLCFHERDDNICFVGFATGMIRVYHLRITHYLIDFRHPAGIVDMKCVTNVHDDIDLVVATSTDVTLFNVTELMSFQWHLELPARTLFNQNGRLFMLVSGFVVFSCDMMEDNSITDKQRVVLGHDYFIRSIYPHPNEPLIYVLTAHDLLILSDELRCIARWQDVQAECAVVLAQDLHTAAGVFNEKIIDLSVALIFGMADGSMQVCHPTTGEQLLLLHKHSAPIDTIIEVPVGETSCVSVDETGFVVIWDDFLHVYCQIRLPARHTVVYSFLSTIIIGLETGAFIVIDVTKLQRTQHDAIELKPLDVWHPSSPIVSIDSIREGKYLLVAYRNGVVLVFNIEHWSVLRHFKIPEVLDNACFCADYGPNSGRIAVSWRDCLFLLDSGVIDAMDEPYQHSSTSQSIESGYLHGAHSDKIGSTTSNNSRSTKLMEQIFGSSEEKNEVPGVILDTVPGDSIEDILRSLFGKVGLTDKDLPLNLNPYLEYIHDRKRGFRRKKADVPGATAELMEIFEDDETDDSFISFENGPPQITLIEKSESEILKEGAKKLGLNVLELAEEYTNLVFSRPTSPSTRSSNMSASLGKHIFAARIAQIGAISETDEDVLSLESASPLSLVSCASPVYRTDSPNCFAPIGAQSSSALSGVPPGSSVFRSATSSLRPVSGIVSEDTNVALKKPTDESSSIKTLKYMRDFESRYQRRNRWREKPAAIDPSVIHSTIAVMSGKAPKTPEKVEPTREENRKDVLAKFKPPTPPAPKIIKKQKRRNSKLKNRRKNGSRRSSKSKQGMPPVGKPKTEVELPEASVITTLATVTPAPIGTASVTPNGVDNVKSEADAEVEAMLAKMENDSFYDSNPGTPATVTKFISATNSLDDIALTEGSVVKTKERRMSNSISEFKSSSSTRGNSVNGQYYENKEFMVEETDNSDGFSEVSDVPKVGLSSGKIDKQYAGITGKKDTRRSSNYFVGEAPKELKEDVERRKQNERALKYASFGTGVEQKKDRRSLLIKRPELKKHSISGRRHVRNVQSSVLLPSPRRLTVKSNKSFTSSAYEMKDNIEAETGKNPYELVNRSAFSFPLISSESEM
ncbi:hypothetical protein PCE1_004767 [Barthelona sp. PCE]